MTPLLPKLYPLILLILGLLFFVPFLGYSPLFDGSELRHAEAAREMLVTNTFGYAQLNFLPDYTTPPLMPWLQALSMRAFGVADNAELAARLPSVLMGIVTILTLFFIGRQKHDARFGFLWALSYLGSATPLILAKSALPATTGYFFMFLGAVFFMESMTETSHRTIKNRLWSGLFFGLGLLTADGMLMNMALIALCLITYWQLGNKPHAPKIRNSLIVLALPVLIASVWLALLPNLNWQRLLFPEATNRGSFGKIGFLAVGAAGMFTVVILASCYWPRRKLPTSALAGLPFRGWIAASALQAILLLIFVPSSLLLVWFFLSYLATYYIHQVLRGERAWHKLNTWLLVLAGVVVGMLMMAVPLAAQNIDWLALHINDPFWAGVLQAPVNWGGWEWMIGVALIVLTTIFALSIRWLGFWAIVGGYGSTALCTLAFLVVIIPRIEQYTQQPLIDFCEAKWKQPVYVQPTFLSYAQLFYTRKQPPVTAESRRLNWLTGGLVDQQTYIITTATDAAQYRYNPNLELLSEEYGYVFFKRKQYR